MNEMDDRRREVEEPDGESGDYEAQAGSSAPAAPAREPPADVLRDDQSERADMAAIDERAATTKTQPMARLQGGQPALASPSDQQSKAQASADGLIQDQRWQDFAGRWDAIQSGFVDDPRRTVEQADRLVADVIDHLSKLFTDERARLETQWSRDGKVETEDLRLAMQRYRDFFRSLIGR
jgi:hypothetical protein